MYIICFILYIGNRCPETTQYYYGHFHYHFHYPWQERTLLSSLEEMKRVDIEDRSSVRASLAKQCGFTGLSILHRLNCLYGFDVILDTVYDAMHNITLNVASHHLHCYLNEGTFTASTLEDRLRAMPWTPGDDYIHIMFLNQSIIIIILHVSPVELKSGRIPEGVTKRLGYWKAEEFRKFTYPASECILGGISPDADYHVWITLVRITELVYNTGRNGWSHDGVKLLKNLIARHNILTEETEGIKSCVVTLHNLLHLPDDIERFSSPDNYWCYVFERAVKGYIERSSNFKNFKIYFCKSRMQTGIFEVLSTC